MRIVHIITRLIVGGAQENTLFSCEGQHELGHDVTLMTGPSLGPEGTLLERAQRFGYRVEVVNDLRRAIHPIRDPRAFAQLTRRLRELRPDVVHTHSSKAGILGRWAAAAAGVPAIVHTIHGLSFTASTSRLVNAAYMTLEWQAAPLTTRIVCVADEMRDQSLAAGIGTPEQYVTVYSGMETAPFLSPPVDRAAVRASLGLTDDMIAIGTIARLFELKGHDDLIDLAPALCAQHPQVRFLWVGDGSLRPHLEARIAAAGLRGRFILTGLVPPARIPELVNAMDILVHPSRREGLARALPQGSLAQIPVVAYDVDGNREGVIHGKTGYMISAFDKPQLAAALERLIANPQLRRDMGKAGQAFALQRFDTQTMVQGLEKVYQDALQTARG